MDRRKFLKRLGAAGAAPILLNGLPVSALAANSPLMKMLSSSVSDRVLIFIQMHGGNDGLNTIIPVFNYTDYQFIRANIAIPDDGTRKYIALDDTLPTADQLGLHPDMQGVKDLYDDKRATVIQAVGYDNMNMSHFRSRDIWFMGIDSDQKGSSGWMGRFLENEYPGYPDNYPSTEMPDPLGLEIGNEVTLAYQQENSIPAGISLANPDSFYNLINSVGVDSPTAASFPDNYYGDELEYLMNFEIKTNDYAARLKEVWDNGTNSSTVYPTTYPLQTPTPYINNPLAEQFKIIARLLAGGIKTRIFMTRIGGFDTHANQVESSDASVGRHAALLYHISETVKAFHDDLRAIGGGLEDRVLTMTFSEFGRRAYSNQSYGTDHGKAGPILLFGNGLKGGVIGTNPDLNDLDNGNIRHQFDYRQVYTTVLSDWLGATDSSIQTTGFADYLTQKLDLIADPTPVHDITKYNGRSKLNSCYPNPVKSSTTIGYFLDSSSDVTLRLYSSAGKLIRELVNEHQPGGNYEVSLNVAGLQSGNYIYRLNAGTYNDSRIMLVE